MKKKALSPNEKLVENLTSQIKQATQHVESLTAKLKEVRKSILMEEVVRELRKLRLRSSYEIEQPEIRDAILASVGVSINEGSGVESVTAYKVEEAPGKFSTHKFRVNVVLGEEERNGFSVDLYIDKL